MVIVGNSRKFNFILILVGGIIAIYAESGEEQNVYLLLAGIFVLMTGLYSLSRGIPNRSINENESFVKHEEEE